MNGNFGNTLYELRTQCRISIDAMAKMMNISPATINDWELSRYMPEEDEIRRLADIFDNYNIRYNPFRDMIVNKSKNPLLNTFIKLTGEDDGYRIKFKDLFKDTFKKHSKGEFIRTKSIEEFDIHHFTKPYMYFRVLCLLIALFFLTLASRNAYLVMFIGTIAIPLSYFVFIWELNVFRNLKLNKCVALLAIGGAMSIGMTLIFNEIFYTSSIELFVGALSVGVIEETAKLLISYYFIKKMNIRHILPAMVIGASVGVGFSIIESLLYAYSGLETSYEIMLKTVLIRGAFSIGGHSVWAAVAAAAFVKANVGSLNNYSIRMIANKNFLKIFVIPIILHTLWNYLINYTWITITITIIGVMLLYAIINAGLKEANRIARNLY